jgi:hypothetical protein
VKLFGKIRHSFGEKSLAKRVRNLIRSKQTHNFQTARTAGILFDAGKPDDFRLIREFSKYLGTLNIDCTMIGYVNADEIRSDMLFRDNIGIFCNKDLDFFFRPSHPDAVKFTSQKFDMLIDLSMADYFPLRFIASLSTASFKIGRYEENDKIFDLMIDIHGKPEVGYLIEQIRYYVPMLSK